MLANVTSHTILWLFDIDLVKVIKQWCFSRTWSFNNNINVT